MPPPRCSLTLMLLSREGRTLSEQDAIRVAKIVADVDVGGIGKKNVRLEREDIRIRGRTQTRFFLSIRKFHTDPEAIVDPDKLRRRTQPSKRTLRELQGRAAREVPAFLRFDARYQCPTG